MRNDAWLKRNVTKVKRQIEWYGETHTFYRFKKDNRGENTNELEIVKTVKGLYHEAKGYVREVIDDSGTTREKRVTVQCMFLALWEDVQGLSNSDLFQYQSKMYRISDINNFGNLGTIAELSLQEVEGAWQVPLPSQG